MADPEAAFTKSKKRTFSHTTEALVEPPLAYHSSRISGDVSMESSNSSADGTLQLRQAGVYCCFSTQPLVCVMSRHLAVPRIPCSSRHGILRHYSMMVDEQKHGNTCTIRCV